MHFIIYKTTNKITGDIYIGKHQTDNLSDDYIGSGKILKQAIRKYGIKNFEKEILFQFNCEADMNSKEAELVTEEFCLREDTYNLCPGGKGGWGYINRSGKNLRNGMVHSEESRKRMGHPNNKNNLGKITSDETKLKLSKIMSEKLKGKTKSEEHKRKIAESIKLRNQQKKDAGIV